MKVLLPLLLGLTTAVGVPVHAATAPTPSVIPVVATSFSNLAPRVGQRETVIAQFYLYRPKKHPQYVAGAHLSVTVKVGTMKVAQTTLTTVKGTTSNTHGKAFARFSVPAKARGKVLWADTILSYKGRRYRGSNRVAVKP